MICNIKSLHEVHIGDTVTIPGDDCAVALPGYQEPKRMVYCGLYPADGEDFEELREALDNGLRTAVRRGGLKEGNADDNDQDRQPRPRRRLG